eukprot:CAMPEP_0198153580 /NCGR_PEP_ID=MMETSP1443-20131203/64822_1 /TAXON_ID=186043 /ORGANISM="Entomoneis sp., Strain CCMP2396" /LENGTH=198 /DNA_ID=CAMNT_0043819975 /DNA_START=121 /DNA_END=714 /DNA_ORIENTATION=+
MMLEGLHCLVTGASSGIGKATCEVLSRYGAKVIGTGRNAAALQELEQQGGIKGYVVADLTEDGACQRVVAEAVNALDGCLTTVVNAAGALRGGAMGEVDLDNYQFNMKLNTQAPFEIMMEAIPHLKKEKNLGPSFVNVSSVNGKQSFASCASYCMSKAALDQLTRCASIDLAPFGIRVNAVNPGVISTNLHHTAGMSA